MSSTQSDFTKGSVKKRILMQAGPLILAQFVQLAYNIIDRVYIGRLPGDGRALAGLGLTFPIVTLIVAFTNLFGLGGTALFSITRGRGDDLKAKKILGNVLVLQCLTSVLLFLIMMIWMKPIMYALGASDASYGYARDYLRIYMFGTVASMLGSGLNGFINACGRARIGMMTVVLGAVLNLILDPIFIFGAGLGVKGAAIATVISQFASCLWVLIYIFKKFELKLCGNDFLLNFEIVRSVSLMGFPYFIMMATNSAVQMACNMMLAEYGGVKGDVYIEVMTAVNSVRELMALPVSGITGGSQPVLGYNYGAKRYDRLREGIKFTAFLGITYTALAWAAILVFPRQLMFIFTKNPTTIDLGKKALFVYFFGFVFMAFQFVGQSVFQSLGYAKYAIFFSLFRKAIIVVPLTVLLPRFGFGVMGVFMAEPVSNLIGGLACFITMYLVIYRRIGQDEKK